MVDRTVDGGVTWTTSSFEPHVETGLRIHGFGCEVWIATTVGNLDASLDGGVTFAPIPTPAGVAFYGIAALGQGRVIAVGSGSVHVRTNKTWKTEIPDELGISAVSATSLSDVWAVGAKGIILHRP